MREKFEAWYSKQKRDQEATWHPAETLEFGKDKYPTGRYTMMSSKQSAWEVWQAATLTALGREDEILDYNLKRKISMVQYSAEESANLIRAANIMVGIQNE